jgi:hypothetical protein
MAKKAIVIALFYKNMRLKNNWGKTVKYLSQIYYFLSTLNILVLF